MGVTSANFSLSGKDPDLIELLKLLNNIQAKLGLSLSIFIGIESIGVALEVLVEFIIIFFFYPLNKLEITTRTSTKIQPHWDDTKI